MSLIALDASVAAKWFLPSEREPLSDQAFLLLRQYQKAEVRFVVPDLFWSEIANIVWKAAKQGRLAVATAHRALAEMQERDLPTVPARALLEQALSLAITFQRPVYDSLYLALAVESNATLITADEKLANAVAAKLPVKWLGAIF